MEAGWSTITSTVPNFAVSLSKTARSFGSLFGSCLSKTSFHFWCLNLGSPSSRDQMRSLSFCSHLVVAVQLLGLLSLEEWLDVVSGVFPGQRYRLTVFDVPDHTENSPLPQHPMDFFQGLWRSEPRSQPVSIRSPSSMHMAYSGPTSSSPVEGLCSNTGIPPFGVDGHVLGGAVYDLYCRQVLVH